MKNFFYILILVLFYSGKAQTLTNSYHIKWINDAQGLTNLNVSNAIRDENGFLWIATDLGLYKYNGFKVVPVINSKYPQLNSQRIINLFQDHNSKSIYFRIFPDEKFYSINNCTIKQLNKKDGIMFEQFFLEKESPFFKAYSNVNNKILDKNYIQIGYQAVNTRDLLYIKKEDIIIILKKDGTYSTIPNYLKTESTIFNIQNTIFQIGYKEIKIISDKSTNNNLKIDKVIQQFINNKDNFKSYTSIIKTNDKYYLNIDSKVYQIHYKNNTLSTTLVFQFKDKSLMRFSFFQGENIYFVGTVNSGLAIVYKNYFNTVTNKENEVEYTIVQKGNNIYSLNGWVFNKKTKNTQFRLKNINYGNFRFILQYKEDYFYQDKELKLFSIIDLKTKLPINLKKLSVNLNGFTYEKNNLWVANPKNAALVVNNQILIDSSVANKLSIYQDINAISSKDSQLIFATTKGVFFHKPFTNHFDYIKGLEKVNARYIKHIDKNTFWVGCYGEGLFLVYKKKAFKVYDSNNEINTTHAIEEDERGNLWIATNNGLLTVNKKKAIKNILSNQPIECYLYTTEDGLPTNEFNGGSTFPSINSEGILGFPSMKGYVWFEPKKIKKNNFIGNIMIDKIFINNQIIKSSVKKYFEIPPKTDFLNIYLKYGYYFNPKNISLIYKFKGQSHWTKGELNNIQIPRYQKGPQTLLIKIHTNGTTRELDVVKSFTFNFQERYYESYCFWIFVFIVFVIFIYLSYKIGIEISKKNKENLEKVIDEKTIILLEALKEVEESKKSLSQTLHEKDILLKEVHHRVKNNLQLIMSMLKIQARRKNYDSIFDFLNKGESRINAMALIHQRLYQIDETLNKIDLQAYLKDLTYSINQTFNDNEKEIKTNIDCLDIEVNLSTAIPVGLIINELLTNSLKHAFQNRTNGTITIQIKKLQNNQFNLIVEDDGIGFDKKTNKHSSFGLDLINLLVQQLKANVTLDFSKSTKYTIVFYEIDI